MTMPKFISRNTTEKMKRNKSFIQDLTKRELEIHKNVKISHAGLGSLITEQYVIFSLKGFSEQSMELPNTE